MKTKRTIHFQTIVNLAQTVQYISHKYMKSATAVSPHDEISLRMDVNKTADTGEVVSPQWSQHLDVPRLRAPDLHLPGSVHGAGEEGVGQGGVPGQSEGGEPAPGVVVVFDLTARPDVLLQPGGVVQSEGVVTAQCGHLVSCQGREDTAGQRPGVTQQLTHWLH